jgi:hypothetical protein
LMKAGHLGTVVPPWEARPEPIVNVSLAYFPFGITEIDKWPTSSVFVTHWSHHIVFSSRVHVLQSQGTRQQFTAEFLVCQMKMALEVSLASYSKRLKQRTIQITS